MKIIVTHRAPDIDAITAVWVLKRFDHQHFADAKIAFVNAGDMLDPSEAKRLTGEDTAREDIVHVDTGLGEFDHHQNDRGLQRICAASLVYEHVKKVHPALADDWALAQIVELALQDDHFEDYFWPEAVSERYLFHLRNILHGLEYTQMHDDESQTMFGMKCLDGVYAALQERNRASRELEKGVEFDSPWGKAVGIETANQGVLRYAQLKGNNLVVQKDPKLGHVRIKAVPLPEIDLSPLAKAITEKDNKGTWFFHAGRHMLLNGSSKNPSQIPTLLSLKEVIAIIESLPKK